MRRLAVLGGGYGGLRIIQRLIANELPGDVEIILVDRTPYHSLKTEFYALAAGTKSDQDVRVSFPAHQQLHFINAEVEKIDLENQQVHLSENEILFYDDLIIALGCEDCYHGIPGADVYTYSIQTIEAARKTYTALNNLPQNSTVGIVGAGLSGVELASELYESRPDLHIKLYDRGQMVLSSFPERISRFVNSWFEEHEIDVINGANVTKVEEKTVYNHDQPEHCDIIVWTAGVQPHKLARELDVEKDEKGRIILTPYHEIPKYENVYVVGDCASLPFPPSAQLAEAQGEQIVDVLLKKWKNEPLPKELPEIKLKGTLGSLGKKQGFGLVADIPMTGRVPRLLKSGILWFYKFID